MHVHGGVSCRQPCAVHLLARGGHGLSHLRFGGALCSYSVVLYIYIDNMQSSLKAWSLSPGLTLLCNKHLLRKHELEPRRFCEALVVGAVIVRSARSISAKKAVRMQRITSGGCEEQAQHASLRLAVAVALRGEVRGDGQRQLLHESVDLGHNLLAAAGEDILFGKAGLV